VRQLKGLEDIIPYTSVHWHMGEKGWRFATAEDKDAPGMHVVPDPVEGHEKYQFLRDLYLDLRCQRCMMSSKARLSAMRAARSFECFTLRFVPAIFIALKN